MSEPQDTSLAGAWQGVPQTFPGNAPGACQACGHGDPNPGPHWKQLADSSAPGGQHHDNCGLEAVYQLIQGSREAPIYLDEQVAGAPHEVEDEDQFLQDAISNCSASNSPGAVGATNANDRSCMLNRYGLASELQDQTVDNLDAALRERKGVIINGDAGQIWPGADGSAIGQHAIVAAYGNYDADGVLQSVHVFDSGALEPQYDIPASKLTAIFASSKNPYMNVTSQPMWPSD